MPALEAYKRNLDYSYAPGMFPSMEAYGLLVSDACTSAGLEYYYGKNTMTYTSCILLD